MGLLTLNLYRATIEKVLLYLCALQTIEKNTSLALLVVEVILWRDKPISQLVSLIDNWQNLIRRPKKLSTEILGRRST